MLVFLCKGVYNDSVIGVSPSGKATDSDSVIRVFESLRPSHGHYILYVEILDHNIWCFYFSTKLSKVAKNGLFYPDLGIIWEQTAIFSCVFGVKISLFFAEIPL